MAQSGQQEHLMDDTMNHMRFVAAVQKRSSPPRCHPISICITIQGIGLVFIGLTMTLIANWPGATSVGSNPLRIAGPIILCFGILICIIGLILTRTLRRKAAKKWDEKVTHMAKAASRQFLEQSETSLAHIESKPVFNIAIPDDKNLRPSEERRYLLSPDITSPDLGPTGSTFDDNANNEDDVNVPQAVRNKKIRKKELAASSQEDLTEDETISEADRQARRQRRRERKRQKELAQQLELEAKANPENRETKPELPAKTSKPPSVKPKPKVEIPGGRESPKIGRESPQLRLHVRPAPGTTVVVHSGRATPPAAPHPRSKAPTHKSVESDI